MHYFGFRSQDLLKMKKSRGIFWPVIFIVVILVIDAYYEIESIQVPIWETSWFWWRAGCLAVIILIVGAYYLFLGERKRKIQLEAFKIKLMETQEAEWKRLAGELHDSVGQNLSAINIYVQQNLKSLPEGSDEKENLKAASDMLVETLDEVRRISAKLYPQQIERLGLTIAIQSMVTKLTTTTGIHFSLKIDSIDDVFPKETEIYFYRIIQEVLNNIIKHSRANNVDINISKAVMFVTVDIADDGIGFETKNLTVSDGAKLGFGLLNLDERIRLVKGTYNFQSEPGKGTKLHLIIPLKKTLKTLA